MDEPAKSVSIGALAIGDLLLKIPPGAELGTLDWALGTPKEWFSDVRSDNPEWHVICVSARQVLALRFRA
jgi:hypothetical protein